MAKAPVPTFDPSAPEKKGGQSKGAKAVKNPPSQKKRRWARLQVQEKSAKKLQRAEGSDDYNIWYHKYYGEEDHIREKATTRCRPKYDQGMTLADVSDNKYICIHFAMGNCTHGSECKFLHRVPTIEDTKQVSLLHDIFGRERHHDHRDDMGGVGSFAKETRTLYVTGMAVMQSPQADEILARHFGEWGPIEEISVKPKYGCAFVRYTHRFFTEFAKIAMAEQSLDHNEQINCRWAHDDPNPKAIVRNKWETEEKLKDRLEELGHSAQGEKVQYDMPATYNPVFKEGVATYGQGLQMYPSTEHQFQVAQAYNPQDHYAANAEYYKQYYQYYQQNQGQGYPQTAGTPAHPSSNKAGPAGPVSAEQMAVEHQKRMEQAAAHKQATMATNYVQQQVKAMNSLDSVLNVIDNFAGYSEGPAKEDSKAAPKKGAEVDAFLASIQGLQKK